MLKAPIPGMSLTTPPKSYPWEQPPQMEDPDEAIRFHITRLNEPERINALIDMIDLGMPVRALAEGLLTSAVMNGRHSIDVSLIIAPVIHEEIKSIAEDAGIEYDEGFDEPVQEKEVREREMLRMKVTASLNKAKSKVGKEVAKESLDILSTPETEYKQSAPNDAMPLDAPIEAMPQEPMAQEAAPMETPRKGLMARTI
jgi:hypothetical protein